VAHPLHLQEASSDEQMTLKIQSTTENETTIFRLSGRITENRLTMLEFVLMSVSQERKIVLDLKDIKLVDRGVVRFLAQQEDSGTTIANCPAYIREWILRERNSNQ
jgi:ABC-type transporter Mla MlaB component